MLKKSKWVKPSAPRRPIAEVAAKTISERLALVDYYLPLAAERWRQEVEFVHQLRVATRRASAALRLFRSLAPKKRRKAMKQRLSQVRRAAGEARDLDVLLERLRSEVDSGHRTLTGITDAIEQRRRAAQKPIRKINQELQAADLPDEIERLAGRVRWRRSGPEPTYEAAAAGLIANVAAGFDAVAARDPRCVEDLHALRIEGKQLRYALEILAAAFPGWVRDEFYPEVEALQSRLGGLNDHATARRNFLHWSSLSKEKHAAADLAKLAKKEQQSLEACQDDFLKWWSTARKQRFGARLRSLKGGG